MLHLVDEADLLEAGVRGDRRFYFVTERGRLFSNKDHGPLQLVRADYDADADALVVPLRRRGAGRRRGRARGGGRDHVPQAAAHRPVSSSGRGRRRVSELVGQPVRLVEPELPAPDRGRGGAATLLATSSLGRLAQQLGVDAVDQPPLPDELRRRRRRGARGGRVARPPRADRRRRRHPAGPRRPLRDHDAEPRHGRSSTSTR